MRRILIIVAILLIPAIPIVLVLSGVIQTKPKTVTPVTLTIWGTEDPQTAFTEPILLYQQTRPYATITYQQKSAEGYYDQLLSAWAQGNGPDLFFVPNTWVGQMTQYATPMPAQLGVSLVKTGTGFLRSGTEVTQQDLPAPSVSTLRNQFVDTVVDDAVVDNQVWGLPLAMDTLVTYVNKDLLNNAKIFEPATTWPELLRQIEINGLTIADEQGALLQSGVALGTVDNLPYSTDLLMLLMLQNGWPPIQSTQDRVLFDENAKTALDFFLGFSNSRKVAYSWNTNQPNARDAFLSGKLAYYFGTLADRSVIEKSNLNWVVGPMLHLSVDGDRDGSTQPAQIRTIDTSRYQVLMVSKASAVQNRSGQAWNLLYYLTRQEIVPNYLQTTGKLSALRSILNTQKDDPTLGTYASQLLTARSWYHGHAGQQAEGFIQDLITSLADGKTTPDDALRLTAEQLTTGL